MSGQYKKETIFDGYLKMLQTTAPYPEEIFTQNELNQLACDLNLSIRQKEIIRCLLAALSDKQIATRLKISMPTVRTHITRLFRKLNANDREELILQVFSKFRSTCRKLDCPRQR